MALKFAIQVDDQGSAKIQKISGAVKDLGKESKTTGEIMQGVLGAEIIKTGFTQLKNFALSAIQSFDEEEKAIRRLETALGGNVDALTAQADALQATTLYADDATISMQAMMGNFIQNKTAIEQLTPLVQDFATATGKDLVTAGEMVAKTFAGGKGLQKFGLDIQGVAGSSQRLTSIVDNMTKAFKGQAEAVAQAGAGPLQILNNQFENLKGNLGGAIIPYITYFAQLITINFPRIVEIIKTLAGVLLGIGGIILSVIVITKLYTAVSLAMAVIPQIFATTMAIVRSLWILMRSGPVIMGTLRIATLALSGAISTATGGLNLLVGVIVALIVTLIPALIMGWEKFMEALKGIGKMLSSIGTILVGVFTLDKDKISEGLDAFKESSIGTFKIIAEEAKKLGKSVLESMGFMTPKESGGMSAGKFTPEKMQMDFAGGDSKPDKDVKKLADDNTKAYLDNQAKALETQKQFSDMMLTMNMNQFEAEKMQLETKFMEQLEMADAMHETGKLSEKEYHDAKLAIAQDFANKKAEIDKNQVNAQLEAGSQILGNLASVFQGSKKYGTAYKALAIAQATIDTFKSANSAYASVSTLVPFGPFLAPAIVASIIASGLANVARISSVKMAGGGIAVGAGGKFSDNVPTMLSPGERVLSNPEIEALGGYGRIDQLIGSGRGGAGGTSIVIQGNVIGREDYVRDELIPQIRREMTRE